MARFQVGSTREPTAKSLQQFRIAFEADLACQERPQNAAFQRQAGRQPAIARCLGPAQLIGVVAAEIDRQVDLQGFGIELDVAKPLPRRWLWVCEASQA